MKKVFLTALWVFALTLTFGLQGQNESLTLNNAFADGTCCKEKNSVCILNSRTYYERYHKSGGSCSVTTEDTPNP